MGVFAFLGPQPAGNRVQPADSRPAAARAPQSEAARREALVTSALREAQRKQGIPSDWMGLETFWVSDRRGSRRVVIRLVVLQGDDSLLQHVSTFQETLLRELGQLEASSHRWVQGVNWSFRGDRDTRFARMPDPSYWS
jgi:hypothetical protein